jgi:hypothetical protein
LLQDLEQLNILRLLPLKQEKKETPNVSKKRKWAGSISSATAEAMHKHVETLRNEWERDI